MITALLITLWIMLGLAAAILVLELAILLLPLAIGLLFFIAQMIFGLISSLIIGIWFVIDRDSAYASMIRHRYKTEVRRKTA